METNEMIKNSILETYKKRFEKELNILINGMTLQYSPKESNEIKILLSYSGGGVKTSLTHKESLFLKKIMLPKLRKEISKMYGTVEYENFVTSIDFNTNEITLFAEFITQDENLKNYLITI